jgi:hypothetical protein
MLKHVGCGGDLSVFGGDEDLLFACNKCGKTWQITVLALGAADAVIGQGGLSLTFDRERRLPEDRSDASTRLLADALRDYPDAFGHHETE